MHERFFLLYLLLNQIYSSMMRANYFKFVLLIAVSLVFTKVQAQFFVPSGKFRNIQYDSSQTGYQRLIASIYPIYPTEVVTKSNEVFRGKVINEEGGYSVVTRNKNVYSFREEDVEEVAWVIPDRRDYTFYRGLGFHVASYRKEVFLPTLGFVYDLNWELPKHDFVVSLPIQFGLEYLTKIDGDLLNYFSAELLLGKRFNRMSKITHTISAGPGLGTELKYLMNEHKYYPYVFGGHYDIEFSIGRKNSIAFFAKYQYFSRHDDNHRLIFGLCFRVYEIGFPQLLMMNPID